MIRLHPIAARIVLCLLILALGDTIPPLVLPKRFFEYWPLASFAVAVIVVIVGSIIAKEGAQMSGEAVRKFFASQFWPLLVAFVGFWLVRFGVVVWYMSEVNAALERAANAPLGPAFFFAILALDEIEKWGWEWTARLMLAPYLPTVVGLWFIARADEKRAEAALARHGIRL